MGAGESSDAAENDDDAIKKYKVHRNDEKLIIKSSKYDEKSKNSDDEKDVEHEKKPKSKKSKKTKKKKKSKNIMNE